MQWLNELTMPGAVTLWIIIAAAAWVMTTGIKALLTNHYDRPKK